MDYSCLRLILVISAVCLRSIQRNSATYLFTFFSRYFSCLLTVYSAEFSYLFTFFSTHFSCFFPFYLHFIPLKSAVCLLSFLVSHSCLFTFHKKVKVIVPQKCANAKIKWKRSGISLKVWGRSCPSRPKFPLVPSQNFSSGLWREAFLNFVLWY